MPLSRILDPFHVGIAEPEMMADFVDQHVADDSEQIVARLAPVIEDRAAVEKDHVDRGQRIADALQRQRDAAIEPEQVERAVEPHRPLSLAVWKSLDADHPRPPKPLEPPPQRSQR